MQFSNGPTEVGITINVLDPVRAGWVFNVPRKIDFYAPRLSRVKGGRQPYPTVLTIKILVLQQLYNSADDALQY